MPDCPCETLWIYDPSALLGTNILVGDICESNNINAFSRVMILGLIFSGLISPLLGFGGLALVLLALLFLYGRWIFAKIVRDQRLVETQGAPPTEGFEADIRPDMKAELAFPNAPQRIMTSPGATVVTRPSAANPFMNVLLDEIKYNPTRPSADFATDPNNQAVLDDFFRVQWASDPTDVFGRSQGQRQFYTMPSTSIPNDQGSFQNWLYLTEKGCKEGNRDACYGGTNGGPIPWLNQPN